MNKNQHVIPHDGQWAVKGAGNNKATHITSTQAQAIDLARQISINQQSELIIHRPNGQIRASDSHDPKNIKELTMNWQLPAPNS